MKKGFTLIEVMIVVVIAVTVAAFAVPAYKKSMDRNKFMAAEGKLIELSSALRNVQQMYGGYSCPKNINNIEDTYKNQDGSLNKQGCYKYPHKCMTLNNYTQATLTAMNSYEYSIEEDCSVNGPVQSICRYRKRFVLIIWAWKRLPITVGLRTKWSRGN